jgi:PKD repeat protein
MKGRALVILMVATALGIALGHAPQVLAVQKGGGGPSWACTCRTGPSGPGGAGASGGSASLSTEAAVEEGETSQGEAIGSVSLELAAQAESPLLQSDSQQSLFRVSSAVVETGVAVTFDASASWSEDEIVLYGWDFDGDGVLDEATGSPVVEHAYDDDGVYGALVRISDASGAVAWSDPVQLSVFNRPPTAGPYASVPAVEEGGTVVFSSASTDPDGRVVAWIWDLGDGTTCQAESCSHGYVSEGTYDVALIVTDDDGGVSTPSAITLSVRNAAPVAAFQVDAATAEVGVPLRFLDTSTDTNPGEIVHVAWDFGDGTYRAGGPQAGGVYTHTYASPGGYTITLYVIDADGSMAVARQEIKVGG